MDGYITRMRKVEFPLNYNTSVNQIHALDGILHRSVDGGSQRLSSGFKL